MVGKVVGTKAALYEKAAAASRDGTGGNITTIGKRFEVRAVLGRDYVGGEVISPTRHKLDESLPRT